MADSGDKNVKENQVSTVEKWMFEVDVAVGAYKQTFDAFR